MHAEILSEQHSLFKKIKHNAQSYVCGHEYGASSSSTVVGTKSDPD